MSDVLYVTKSTVKLSIMYWSATLACSSQPKQVHDELARCYQENSCLSIVMSMPLGCSASSVLTIGSASHCRQPKRTRLDVSTRRAVPTYSAQTITGDADVTNEARTFERQRREADLRKAVEEREVRDVPVREQHLVEASLDEVHEPGLVQLRELLVAGVTLAQLRSPRNLMWPHELGQKVKPPAKRPGIARGPPS